MPSGTKFLLILVVLIVVGGIGFYSLLPHYLKTNRSPEEQEVARVLEDVERAKELVKIAMNGNAPTAADGRVDIYHALLAAVTDTAELVDLCRRSGNGPTLEQIRDGDYSEFPYERARGAASEVGASKPVFWDRAPTTKGSRLVALSDGAVFVTAEEKFQAAMSQNGEE